TAWLWVLGMVAVADGLRMGEERGNAQLGTWKFTDAVWVRGMVNLPGALLMLAIALVIGALAAWPAGPAGGKRVGVAVDGDARPGRRGGAATTASAWPCPVPPARSWSRPRTSSPRPASASVTSTCPRS